MQVRTQSGVAGTRAVHPYAPSMENNDQTEGPDNRDSAAAPATHLRARLDNQMRA